jgi:radical SAM superfamily enzyme YgiQ (UPF0313 family)
MTARPLRIALGDLSHMRLMMNLYVPLNIGYVASYAKRMFGREIEIELFKNPAEMLDHVREVRPEVIGLSSYYWNDELNKLMVRKVRAIGGYDPAIVLGGPSIDSDPAEQALYMARHPGIDHVVVNEGEEGFAAIAAAMLGNAREVHSTVMHPERVGLSTDLANVPSPYLDGTLDKFLTGPYQPMIQTSRLCPYTCSFCVSGKNRGKLRAFPIEQISAEIDFIVPRFRDRPDHIFYMTDENFGILQRDVEIARLIRKAKDATGYPKRVYYYNDKRFTQTSRDVQEVLGDCCWHGVMLSLQSENPETLKAIKRRNLTDEEIRSAIGWAHGLGLKVSTELIFGLPMETRASFLAILDKCARLGFDVVQCYNLIIFDGIEMNRQSYRDQHALRTKRRLTPGSATWLDGELCVESEEVAVGASTFSFDDYAMVRALTIWFHAIFVNGMHREFFRGLVGRGGSLTGFLERLMVPSRGDDLPSVSHRRFLGDLAKAMRAELLDDEILAARIKRARMNGTVPTSIKVQPVFAKRLADAADGWVWTIIQRVAEEETAAA